MTTESTTPTREVLDHRLQNTLGAGLDDLVKAKRAESPRRSWRLIARDIYEATGRDVTSESLRSWFPNVDAEVDAQIATGTAS